ncbi:MULTISPECIES: flagellar basal body protein [unclassified Pseudodesulfovibrio]|uniref:flagellar basal body protein n=1 Tax=unclassified Pseudodesulfovibrio TaxID=2661612 RepID=UPI000FEB641F|nr:MULTISPECIES: flagellar basal body protein [unclassified Pseudodesulfovibrio]MCJ2163161.1 flagellar basal body protein [Pseudodesulfovibrio sp. S3-i]RWU07150.1 flagellar basal body rod protein [Pseudodesulfovibrio sp. S3]
MSDTNFSALTALSTVQEVSANNIANVNTDGFKASSVVLESGPEGQGVDVAAINQSTTPGAMLNGVETSNTDIGHEMVDMIKTGHAFSANTVFIRASEEMTGHLLNMIA